MEKFHHLNINTDMVAGRIPSTTEELVCILKAFIYLVTSKDVSIEKTDKHTLIQPLLRRIDLIRNTLS